jgi:DNA-directed RNA polymerase subunit RPC12/RpoP
MQIELRCPYCACRLSAAYDTAAEDILDVMTEEGPWFALGRGRTFEDMVQAALAARGRIRCPECGADVSVHEESADLMGAC